MSEGILWAVPASQFVLWGVRKRFPIKPHIHCTFKFGCLRKDVEHLINQPIRAVITSNAWNDNIQALRIDLLNLREECEKEVPHITWSHTKEAVPNDSNIMLLSSHNSQNLTIPVRLKLVFYEF